MITATKEILSKFCISSYQLTWNVQSRTMKMLTRDALPKECEDELRKMSVDGWVWQFYVDEVICHLTRYQ